MPYPSPFPPSPWSGSVMLYGWLPWVNADVTAKNRDRSIDVSYSLDDILGALKFAAFGTGELRYGRFGVVTDLIYTDLEQTQTSGGPLGSSVDGELQLALWTNGLGYRVYEGDRFDLDLMAGGRLAYTGTDLTATGGGLLGAQRRASSSQTWFDPLVGFRVQGDVTEKVTLRATADVGGFGVGSELTWEVFTGATYRFTPHVGAELGFRYLSIDYDADRLDYDVELYGPALGVVFTF
jgi:hypothetical protein